MTFKNITINLTHPICQCVPDDGDKSPLYSWAISSSGGRPGLLIECTKCCTTLNVQHAHFKASFSIANPHKTKQPEVVKRRDVPKRRKLPNYLRIVKD